MLNYNNNKKYIFINNSFNLYVFTIKKRTQLP